MNGVCVCMCDHLRSKAILHHFQHRSQIFFAPRGAESKEAFEEQTESHDIASSLAFMVLEELTAEQALQAYTLLTIPTDRLSPVEGPCTNLGWLFVTSPGQVTFLGT